MSVSLKRYDRNDYDYSSSPDQNLAPHKKAKIDDSPSPEQSLPPSKKAKKEYRFALEKFPPYIIGSILSYADPKCLGILRQADSSYRNINYRNPVASKAPKALVDASTNCNLQVEQQAEENAIKNIRGNTRNILNSKYIKMRLNSDVVSRTTHDLIALKMLQKACQKYGSNPSELRHRIEHFYRHLDQVSGFDRTHAFLDNKITELGEINPPLVSKILAARTRFAERRPSLKKVSSDVMRIIVNYTDFAEYRALMQVCRLFRRTVCPNPYLLFQAESTISQLANELELTNLYSYFNRIWKDYERSGFTSDDFDSNGPKSFAMQILFYLSFNMLLVEKEKDYFKQRIKEFSVYKSHLYKGKLANQDHVTKSLHEVFCYVFKLGTLLRQGNLEFPECAEALLLDLLQDVFTNAPSYIANEVMSFFILHIMNESQPVAWDLIRSKLGEWLLSQDLDLIDKASSLYSTFISGSVDYRYMFLLYETIKHLIAEGKVDQFDVICEIAMQKNAWLVSHTYLQAARDYPQECLNLLNKLEGLLGDEKESWVVQSIKLIKEKI